LRVAIIGQGYVGTAFKELIKSHYETVTYDPAFDSRYPEKEISACELAVVCVPTPMSKNGECDTSIVEQAISRLTNEHILIKSTVAPGTTDRLQKKTGKPICFSPEYIGESTYYNPVYPSMKETPFLIIGGPKDERAYMFDVFTPILGPYTRYFGCEAVEAELIKYMENSFFATKVTFVNEFYEIAKRFNADWHAVREGWQLDERIGRGSSAVFVGKRGFSGKCLPKDVNAIVWASENHGYSPKVLKAVLKSNDVFSMSLDANSTMSA
jgi:UDPglucose 6-dehydrogenase